MKEEEYIDTISLQVAAQIIKHISAGLYRSPGSSIKELLSNSFDADASNVVVTFHFSYPLGELHLDKITIRDDGVGMSVKDLYYVFTHIGGSEKDTTKGSKLTEKKGRKVIGRMGIGMLSVASACRGFIVRTKKAEETREYIAKISLSFFDDTIKRSESMDKSKLGNVDLMSRYMEGYDSYTEVEISEFKPPFLEMMVPTITRSFIWNSQKNGENDSEYFEKFVEFIQYEEKLGKLAQIDRLVTDIGCMSPVEYLPDGPVRKKIIVNGEEVLIPGTNDPEYDAIKNMAKNLDFNVKIRLEVTTGQESSLIRNSFKVFKPFLYPNLRLVEKVSFDKLEPYVYILPNREDKILNDNGEYEQAIVRGYYYHQSKRISPVEYSGLLFRVFNVAMGNEFSDPMKFFVDTYMIYQQSLVEISLEDGFQEIVNLDREGLFEGSNAYRYLKNYLIHYIRGDPPPKPVQIKTETQQVEKQFTREQEKLFPENKGESIISKVKKNRAQYRKEEIKKRTLGLKQKILENYDLQDLEIKRVHSVKEVGLYPEDNVLVAKIPTFTKRKELWDLLCVGLLHNLTHDDAQKERIITFLLDLYSEVEEGKNREN